MCSSGFHACEYPLDVFRYYKVTESVFATVTLSGETVTEGDKVAASGIHIDRMLTLADLIEEQVKLVVEKSGDKHTASSGYGSTSASSGDRSTSASSGRNSTSSAEGINSAAAVVGIGGKAKAGPGGAIAILFIRSDGARAFACGTCGVDIKADTWYEVVDGILKEVGL